MRLFEVKLLFDIDELKEIAKTAGRAEAIDEVKSWIDLAVAEVMIELEDKE